MNDVETVSTRQLPGARQLADFEASERFSSDIVEIAFVSGRDREEPRSGRHIHGQPSKYSDIMTPAQGFNIFEAYEPFAAMSAATTQR